jgi:hypothetical protein
MEDDSEGRISSSASFVKRIIKQPIQGAFVLRP